MKKTALITGISGQDGSYLAEFLLTQNYRVFGLLRRHSNPDAQTFRIAHIKDEITWEYGDVTDAHSVEKMIRLAQPDEIYHLAAQSHVRISFHMPKFTTDVNVIGTTNVLEACRTAAPYCKFYQASSSEMFGNNADEDGYQRETTPMHPVSPYGCGKLFCYSLVRNYRRAYKMFAVNGILFNHESPRRGSNFVSAKIVRAAKAIKDGKQNSLLLGNIDTARDWGHAKDYVKAMYLMMNHKKPDDFVIASGNSHSVREVCKYVFSKFGLDYENFVQQGERYVRPEDVAHLKGDSSKARQILGWEPEYNFQATLDDMIENLPCQHKTK